MRADDDDGIEIRSSRDRGLEINRERWTRYVKFTYNISSLNRAIEAGSRVVLQSPCPLQLIEAWVKKPDAQSNRASVFNFMRV